MRGPLAREADSLADSTRRYRVLAAERSKAARGSKKRSVASVRDCRRRINPVNEYAGESSVGFPANAWGKAMDSPATVFVIDDDADVRDGLARLLRAVGWSVRVYAAAEEFLNDLPSEVDGCVLLDVGMPGMSGPQLHARMTDSGVRLPVVYLTGRSSVSIGVNAMKQGASDFLEKPVDDDVLIDAIEQAVAAHRNDLVTQERRDRIWQLIGRLSPREREVMDHVIAGRLNKQIAADLAIAEKTVKIHRGRAMAKMEVRSVAQLVRLCEAVGVGRQNLGPDLAATRNLP